MKFIYTISHPLTNEVVYVGCTKDFESRKLAYFRQRKIFRPIDQYINDLRDNYLYPKIELLAECDDDNAFEEEMFYIRLLRYWGFDLLNIFKLTPAKTNLYSTNKSSYTGIPIFRKSRSWDESMFFVGNILELNGTKRSIFTANFKNYCRKFGVKLFLKYSEDLLTAEIISEKPPRKIIIKKGFWAKGADRKSSYSKGREDTLPLRDVGVKTIVKGYKDLRSFASIASHYLKDIPKKRFNYKLLDNGDIEAIRIY